MAMTETQRTTLYSQLTDAIGQDAARTLMEQLPPSGWDQVATKDDVKASERLLQRELKASEKTASAASSRPDRETAHGPDRGLRV